MTTHGQSHGPFELWGSLASGPAFIAFSQLNPQAETPSQATFDSSWFSRGHRVTAVRVHQTSDHVDGVQVRFDGDRFHGTAGRSAKPTAVVTLDLDEDEDITSIKLTFANEMMWAKSLAFTTSKGRVVDSGDAIQQLSAGGFVSRYNQPSVTMANNGAPLAGFEDIICLEEDPEMGACLTQKITFKFSPPPG